MSASGRAGMARGAAGSARTTARAVRVGERAPGFALDALDGGVVTLDAAREGVRAVVLVFLRHLG